MHSPLLIISCYVIFMHLKSSSTGGFDQFLCNRVTKFSGYCACHGAEVGVFLTFT